MQACMPTPSPGQQLQSRPEAHQVVALMHHALQAHVGGSDGAVGQGIAQGLEDPFGFHTLLLGQLLPCVRHSQSRRLQMAALFLYIKPM